jgi:transposase
MKRLQPPPTLEREALELMPVSALVEIILKQQEMIQKLFEEVERLKEIIGQDSNTTSKPPSSDLHKRSEKARPEESSASGEAKRKPGGQPGHPGRTRKGFSRVDRYELLRPVCCPDCGGESFADEVSRLRRQQVAQLHPRPIEVVEYQQASCACLGCGAVVQASLPEDVVAGHDLGVGLQAMLVWLGEYGHLSYEKQQEWLWEMGAIQIGLGTLCATTRRVAELVTPQVAALTRWVKYRPQVQVDESPWLVKGVKEWMWVFTGERFCLFHAGDTRSRAELELILGHHFAGVLSSDDFSVYNGYDAEAQQKCLAHLLRHFKRVRKLKLTVQIALADVFIALIAEAFKHHQAWRTTQDRTVYDAWAADFKLRVAQALQDWTAKAGYAAGLLLRNLKTKSDQWWYFLDHPEIPPDNNRSERALRLAVTKRKVCGGSRSMKGFADTATLLTVVQTCRAQGRSVLEFLRQAISQSVSKLALIPVPIT